jgi:hypothetical protein
VTDAFDRPSHRSLGDDLGGAMATEEYLNRRLNRARDLERARDLAQQLLLDPEKLRKLQEGLRGEDLERLRRKAAERPDSLFNDPAISRLLEQMGRERLLSPEDLERLRRWVPEDRVAPPPSPLVRDLPEPPARGGDPHRPATPAPAPPVPPSAAAAAPSEPDPGWLGRQMRRLAEGLDADELRRLEGTESLAEFLRELARLRPDDAALDSATAARWSGAAHWLSRLQDQLPTDRGRPREWLSTVRHWRLPSLPDVGGAGTGPGGGLGPGTRMSGDQVLEAVLWGLAGVGLAFAVWKLLELYRNPSARDGEADFDPGPWPVAPGAVASRADLVRAFEHLALRALGRSAIPCHHRAIAARLGEVGPSPAASRRDAARRLAAVYERARYAPAGVTLGADELAAARRDLVSLAGPDAA